MESYRFFYKFFHEYFNAYDICNAHGNAIGNMFDVLAIKVGGRILFSDIICQQNSI